MTNQPNPKTPSAQQPASSVVVAQLAVPALRNQRPAVARQSESAATQVSLRSHLHLQNAKPQDGLLESFLRFSFQAVAWVPQHA
jgi:hypothetical protein